MRRVAAAVAFCCLCVATATAQFDLQQCKTGVVPTSRVFTLQAVPWSSTDVHALGDYIRHLWLSVEVHVTSVGAPALELKMLSENT